MPESAARVGVRLVLLLSLLPTVASAEPLQNADFADGLVGWVSDVSQADVPGTIQIAGGRAVIEEQGPFLTALRQTFVVPAGFTELSFELEALPGFDTVEGGIPDAFEARLLRVDGTSALPVADPNTTAFFNLPETGDACLASGVLFDGTTVTVDVSTIPAGSTVVLEFSLVGADRGASAAVAIGALETLVINGMPVAFAGEDRTVECGEEALLDGRGSFDGEAHSRAQQLHGG